MGKAWIQRAVKCQNAALSTTSHSYFHAEVRSHAQHDSQLALPATVARRERGGRTQEKLARRQKQEVEEGRGNEKFES